MSAPNPESGSHDPSATDRPSQQPGEAYRPTLDRRAKALIKRIQRNPNDVEAIDALRAHYEITGDQPSLVNLMEGWGDTLTDPRAAADAYVRAADAALVGLSDRKRAKTLYERALSRDASHTEALDRVLRVLEDMADFDRTKQVLKYVAYQLESREYDPQHLASVHYRLGRVYETHFAEPGKAVTAYRRALEINPRLIAAIAAARKIYAQVGNPSAIAVLYELEIEATPAAEDKLALLISLAAVRQSELGEQNAAIVALRRALQLVPGNIGALRALGEALVARSEVGPAETREADQRRAAEVFYQLARAVPRGDASAHLARALELHQDHEKAAALLRELTGHGRQSDPAEMLAQPSEPSEPQQELDARLTVRAQAPSEALVAGQVRSESAAESTVMAVIEAMLDAAPLPTADATMHFDPSEATAAEEEHGDDDDALQAPPAETSAAAHEVTAHHASQPATAPLDRDSAEAWLHDADIESASAVSTSELLPVSEEEAWAGATASERASSLPPDALDETSSDSHAFLAPQSLRAPRVPSFGAPSRVPAPASVARSVPRPPPAVARSVPPPPPSAAARSVPLPPPPAAPRSVPPPPPSAAARSVPPPPPLGSVPPRRVPAVSPARAVSGRHSEAPGQAAHRPTRSAPPPLGADSPAMRLSPPPAYAEIPGAGADALASPQPRRAFAELQGRRSRPDPTLIEWQLPPKESEDPPRPSSRRANEHSAAHAPSERPTQSAAPSLSTATVEHGAATASRVEHGAATASGHELASQHAVAESLASTFVARISVHSTLAERRSTSSVSPDAAVKTDTHRSANPEAAAPRRPSAAASPSRAALDDRVSALARTARQEAAARRHGPPVPSDEAAPEELVPMASPTQADASAAATELVTQVASASVAIPVQPMAAADVPTYAPPPRMEPELAHPTAAAEPALAAPRFVPAEPPQPARRVRPSAAVQAIEAAQPLPPPRARIVTHELPPDPSRVELEVNLGATTDSNFYVGFENRLADGGVFVATYSPLPVGSSVALTITLPGDFQAGAYGRVRLTREAQDPFGEQVPGICVEFEALSADALALFERFAQKRTPIFIDQ